ncbi:unnamed protein product [Lactuca saligna]|uniref:Ionotropic glutamate receptor C-terminal domain-containing protein n=1 Tax=Lactuca saligna TaxID=75948 RepID=A0AA36EIW3_LACSI|nr:unnamed protein product [Lactuca saligna]
MLVVVSGENGYGMGGDGFDWWWCLLEGNNLKNGEKFIAGKEKGRGVRVEIFQKGSPLIEEVSREIARIRLDGTLGSLENKWFKNQLSLPSRNSTMPKDLKLDSFSGLFIINAATSTLTLLISLLWLLFLNFMERFDLAIVDLEGTDEGREILPYLAESLQDKNIRISYRSAISASATYDSITQELRKIMTFHTTVIILHVSPSLASTLILNAKRLEMVSGGYAWILTEKTVDLLRSTNFTVIESTQGALGFRSYVSPSDRLHSLTTKWHSLFYGSNFTSITKEVPVPALWAYDTIWALAESVEKVGVPHNGSMLLHEVLKIRFKGISGDFQLSEGKVISNGYEIMNAVDNGSEAVVWPGGSTTAPKGWVLRATPSKRLKFGVQNINNFKYFMDVDHDVEKNVTTATGFSADVFYTCIRALPYEVPYTFISFDNVSIDDLVQKVYNEEIDAVIGDSTILANRSEYVDFTATYTDLGVGTLVRIKKKDMSMWFFLKPLLDFRLWLVAIVSLIFNAFVVWAIERMNPVSEVSLGTVSRMSFLLTILFAQKDRFSSNPAKFVIVDCRAIESASKRGIVGFHGGDFMKGVTVNNLHFENWNHRPYYSYEAYAHALSKDGEADAIVDEIPYIKMFLSRYPGDYALVSSQPLTSGFAFIFQKGSPLVEDVSREIARIRLDGTLGSLENK